MTRPSASASSAKLAGSTATDKRLATGSSEAPTWVSASEIAEAAVGAAEAGAAIVHLHARDPRDGRPDQTPEAFEPFLRVIKQRSDCVVNITTGGAPTMTIQERVRPAATWKPEVASLNMGTMNFGLFPMLNRFENSLKHQWERDYLSNRDIVFRNTFGDIEHILTTLGANTSATSRKWWNIIAYAVAILLYVGFMIAPLAVLFGAVK